jgi:orotate phosphoribosyltransferase
MDTSNTVEILKECSAMLEGHFLLSSGRHSDRYFQCARLLQYPQKAEAALRPLVQRLLAFRNEGKLKFDAVVGPALGGIVVAYEIGRQLGVPAFWTERDETGAMALRRGFEVSAGMNILIAEDVVTTGKSSGESIKVLEMAGAKVSALCCIVDRIAPGVELELPFYSAVKLEAANWEAAECPLCKKKLPVLKPGSRKISV